MFTTNSEAASSSDKRQLFPQITEKEASATRNIQFDVTKQEPPTAPTRPLLRRQSERQPSRSRSTFDAYSTRSAPSSIRTTRTDREDLRSSYRAQSQMAARILRDTVQDDMVILPHIRRKLAQPPPSNFSWAPSIRKRPASVKTTTTRKTSFSATPFSDRLSGQTLKNRVKSISIPRIDFASFTKRPSGLWAQHKGPNNKNDIDDMSVIDISSAYCHSPESAEPDATLPAPSSPLPENSNVCSDGSDDPPAKSPNDPVTFDGTKSQSTDLPPAPLAADILSKSTSTSRFNFISRGRALSLQTLKASPSLNLRNLARKAHGKSPAQQEPETVAPNPAVENNTPTKETPNLVDRTMLGTSWEVPPDLDVDAIIEAFAKVKKQRLSAWAYRPPIVNDALTTNS